MGAGVNRQILLVEKPVGKLGPGHFRLVETAVPEPKDGEALLRVRYLSLDAASRAWMQGTTYRYDARYYDIVPDQRIIYAYEMYANDTRISVSVATIEFTKDAAGTALAWTEQGTYLDGIDGSEAPSLRQEGVTEMLDNLTGYLAAPAAS